MQTFINKFAGNRPNFHLQYTLGIKTAMKRNCRRAKAITCIIADPSEMENYVGESMLHYENSFQNNCLDGMDELSMSSSKSEGFISSSKYSKSNGISLLDLRYCLKKLPVTNNIFVCVLCTKGEVCFITHVFLRTSCQNQRTQLPSPN